MPVFERKASHSASTTAPATMPAAAPAKVNFLQKRLSSITGPNAAPNSPQALDTRLIMEPALGLDAITSATNAITRTTQRPSQFLYKAIKLCNDCDLGYRQSRNKRLQVELCLIQSTQSTDDDGAGAGLCPAKILKPIFKIQPQEKPAPAPKKEKSKPVTPHVTPAAEKPALRTLNLNSTSIRKKSENAPVAQEDDIQTDTQSEVAENGQLELDALILAWQQFANRLPKAEVTTAQRMRTITPQLIDQHHFSVTVNNPLIEKDLTKLRPKIESYIKHQCHTQVSMEIHVAPPEVAIKTYSKPDQFKLALQDSSAFRILHELFSLELA